MAEINVINDIPDPLPDNLCILTIFIGRDQDSRIEPREKQRAREHEIRKKNH